MFRKRMECPYNLLCTFTILLLFTNNINAKPDDKSSLTSSKIGRNIYQKGILPNGEAITALGKDGRPFIINRTACIDCHRRSGLGTSESGLLIAPITKKYLIKGSTKIGKGLLDRVGVPRPIYNDETLKTVIRTGVKPNGGLLHEIMPRYKFSDDEIGHLVSYLKSLGEESVPGLTDNQIDLATVITPEMSEDDKELMLSTMRIYFGNINQDVRQLDHMKNPLHGRYKPYRRWKLHIWNLVGDATSWKSQLEKKYSENPVFALIGGYGNWQPIHQFCEKNKIPSLFPMTDMPSISKKDFYTLYFSKGIQFDAEALAKQLINNNKIKSIGAILQVFSNDPASTLAAQTFSSKLKQNEISSLNEINIGSSVIGKPTFWKSIYEKYSPQILIVWLDSVQTNEILNLIKNNKPEDIYLSSRLINESDPQLIASKLPSFVKDSISLVHPFYMVNKNRNHLLRTKLWARSKKVSYENERVFANTYFGLVLLTGAIHTSRYNLNREYLMEQFEHMIDNTVFHSIYPHLSLGPDQRYGSKGVYIIKVSPKFTEKWIIPY